MYLYISFYFLYLVLTTPRQCPCLHHIANNLTRRCSNAVCLNCAWRHEITVLTLSTMAGKYLNRLGHMADLN